MKPTVGVVIVVAGRHDHLARTLASLRDQARPPDDLVVVDMADDPATARLVDAAGVARLVTLATTHGDGWPLAAARNAGAREVAAEHLVFLDVDCLAGRDLVASYAAALALHPRSLACGPVRHLHEDWLHRVRWRPDGRTLEAALRECSAPAARPVPAGPLRPTWDHELFWSLAFGTSRRAWDDLGGFDEGYVGYGAEDTDFGLRARAAGIPMRWLATGTAFHQWHPPSRDDPANHEAMVRNARRYRARWGAWPMPGWLEELDRRGLIRLDDEGGTIDLAEAAP